MKHTIAAISLSLLALTLAIIPSLHLVSGHGEHTLTLLQGDNQWVISPVEQAQSPSAFYNFYSYSGHTPYMESLVSKIYLYRDTNAEELSIVMHHGIDNDVPGVDMAIAFDFEGLPDTTYVSVSDDPKGLGLSTRSPEWDELDLTLVPEGYWELSANSDGGVLSGLPLEAEWEILLHPEFLTGITAWTYVDGDGTEITLAMDQTITLRYTITLSATINIEPDTLNTKSGGKWITAQITPPTDYTAADIDITTIQLVIADTPIQFAGKGRLSDGDLLVKFNRQTLIESLDGATGDLELTVTGQIGLVSFHGSDIVTVIADE